LTNTNLFDLDTVPQRLLILGAGPIGLEMGQAFARLGSQVTILTHGPRILSKDDAELTEELADCLEAEGLTIQRNAAIDRVEHGADDVTVHFTTGGQADFVTGDRLLVALGRRANVEGLGLESVGLEPAPAGLALNPYLQTAEPWLYAAGDVKGHHQFSHSAEDEARTAVRNALLPGRQKADWRLTPWCTFTSPELAHLGPTEDELHAAGRKYRVYRWSFADDDRARTDGAAVGQVKLLATPAGRLLGAHVLGPRAGEVLNELVYAARKKGHVADLAFTIHVYPTLGLTVQRAADQWFEEVLDKPLIGSVMRRITRRTR
jgi:pyruvate/2-oxoglutarate dehydrogenase complex dihydrolipoamide dehydrogenase (E3) component